MTCKIQCTTISKVQYPISCIATENRIAFRQVYPILCSYEPDLDPMTLIYEPDVAILKMYLQLRLCRN